MFVDSATARRARLTGVASGPVRRAGAQALALFSRLARAVAGRWAIRQMAVLDDRMLADIGLTRLDVESALSLPLAADPRLDLAARREERIRAMCGVRGRPAPSGRR